MPRKLLLFAFLAITGSVLVLWLVTRDTKAESTTASNETSDSKWAANDPRSPDRTNPALPGDPNQPAQPNDQPQRDPSRNPRNVDPSRPHASTVTETERGSQPQPTEPPLEYTLPDGRRVRDFRSPDKRKPLEIPPSIEPPNGRRIKPELTGAFTEQIAKHLAECGKAVPRDVRGDKPRLEGQIVIAIKSENVVVTSATFRLTQIANATVAETAQKCVEAKTLTSVASAPGEADLDAYSINLSLVLL